MKAPSPPNDNSSPANALAVLRLMLTGFLVAAAAAAVAQSRQAPPQAPALVRVGPTQVVRSLAVAAQAVAPGGTIELEAGNYVGDVAVIDKDNVKIIGTGGRARFQPNGAHAEGKGVLVVRANGVTIENVEITGARVADRYGSGIRLERGSLRVRNSRFADNELSIMTANDPSIVLEIENCEFSGLVERESRSGTLSHAVYAGVIDTLRVQGSYFHDGSTGHLLKSRARNNFIRYNRLTDEGGVSSYELEFPDGGNAAVVGNVIQQGPRTENPVIVSYGAEGSRWPENRFNVLFNTIINDRQVGGVFVAVRTASAEVRIRNNLWVGPGSIESRAPADIANNCKATETDFVAAATYDYRPRLDVPWFGTASALQQPFPEELLPTREYRHPAGTRALGRRSPLQPLSPGAMQSVGR